MIPESVIVIALGFLLGAFPTAYILGRLLKGVDMRQVGTQNPGTLNSIRELGKGPGILVFVIDTGKGAVAVFIGQRIGAPDFALYTAAFLSVIGHSYSPFLGFRGGKGAATALGVSDFMLWQITLISIGVGLVIFAVKRHAVWSVTGVFIMINALTIATSQAVGLIILCLIISLVVAGIHVARQYPQLATAVRHRQWRRFLCIE